MIFDEMHTFRSMVIGKMMDYVKKKNGSDEEAQKAFLLGYLHDIGYLFDGDDETHARVGGEVFESRWLLLLEGCLLSRQAKQLSFGGTAALGTG